MSSTPDIAEEITYCTVHPEREATLHCNKCGRPMCVQCAVQTPVGYRCKECVRGIQDKYYNAAGSDDLLAFGVAAAAAAVAAFLIGIIPMPLFILLILGFPAGGVVSEVIVRVVQKRRSRNMPVFAAVGAVIGGVVGAVLEVYISLSNQYAQIAAAARSRAAQLPPIDLGSVVQIALSDIGTLLVIGIIAVAVYSRLRMRG